MGLIKNRLDCRLLPSHNTLYVILCIRGWHQIIVVGQYIQYIGCDIRGKGGPEANVLHTHVQQCQQYGSCLLFQVTQRKLLSQIQYS